MVHGLPVVLDELDDIKRAGSNPEIRDAAHKADRRLKALRDNGNVRIGARVAGDIYTVFEHTEPVGDGLPGWLDLTVPDDRLVASALLLQSAHPGSTVHVATSDLNLQTKLAAVGLSHLEPPSKRQIPSRVTAGDESANTRALGRALMPRRARRATALPLAIRLGRAGLLLDDGREIVHVIT